MGCAIGMTVAAACEIIYWLTLKPVTKLMVYYNVTLSARAKYVYNFTLLMIYISLCLFCFHKFQNVYQTYINRKYFTWNKCVLLATPNGNNSYTTRNYNFLESFLALKHNYLVHTSIITKVLLFFRFFRNDNLLHEYCN